MGEMGMLQYVSLVIVSKWVFIHVQFSYETTLWLNKYRKKTLIKIESVGCVGCSLAELVTVQV